MKHHLTRAEKKMDIKKIGINKLLYPKDIAPLRGGFGLVTNSPGLVDLRCGGGGHDEEETTHTRTPFWECL